MIEQGQPHVAAHGHEPLETNVRAVWITGAALAGVVVASFLLMLGLLELFADASGAVPASQFTTADPNALRAQQLQSLRARESLLLEQYHWTDAAAGIARIPIERAIEIVAGRGLSSVGDDSAVPTETSPSPDAANTDADNNPP